MPLPNVSKHTPISIYVFKPLKPLINRLYKQTDNADRKLFGSSEFMLKLHWLEAGPVTQTHDARPASKQKCKYKRIELSKQNYIRHT